MYVSSISIQSHWRVAIVCSRYHQTMPASVRIQKVWRESATLHANVRTRIPAFMVQSLVRMILTRGIVLVQKSQASLVVVQAATSFPRRWWRQSLFKVFAVEARLVVRRDTSWIVVFLQSCWRVGSSNGLGQTFAQEYKCWTSVSCVSIPSAASNRFNPRTSVSCQVIP